MDDFDDGLEGSDIEESDDEEPPEEDRETRLFCQFENVISRKSKGTHSFEVQVKHGVAHIRGKDYVLDRASGKFAWGKR